MNRIVFNVADWRKDHVKAAGTLDAIVKKIDEMIGEHVSGCITVTLAGPVAATEIEQSSE